MIQRWRGLAWFWSSKWAPLLAISMMIGALGCRKAERPLEPRSVTWAELRTVRSGVHVQPPGESERVPYLRERLADGARLRIEDEGLAWLRRDAGATLLVRGPAALTLRAKSVEIASGRLFLDAPADTSTELETPRGTLSLTEVRTSVDVLPDGTVRAYVLSGEARSAGARARAGEALVLRANQPPEVTPVRAFTDWTGGLATTDRAAAPAPYGVGTVGARRPGDQGAPRFPLAIQRLAVHVTVDGDFAITEVDQTFFNPSSDTVEGMYGFRTPERATLERFGVDRDGVVIWGRVKERAAAAAQYQQNVYQGSSEDPALLEWDAPGVYKARLYPIGPGAARRVVVRYAEWLGRTGPAAERRLYVYPMAAEGAEASLPHIEELTVSFDLSRAAAKEVRSGMTGVREGDTLYVRRQDFVPRADLALELFDDGPKSERAYRAKHEPDLELLPPAERAAASDGAKKEADYVLVPLRRELAQRRSKGLDLALVVDASAATEPQALAIARAATRALITHLGAEDRLVVWAGDERLRPVVPELSTPTKVDEALRQRVLCELGRLERGGASDLGTMLASAAEGLDPAREQAIVYIGDGQPTVGELSLTALRERLGKLTHPARLFALGVSDSAHLDVLSGLAQGGFAERVSDANQAARAALRVLEAAERPAWLDVHVDLGPTVERVFPREPGALVSDETELILGRLAAGAQPASVKLSGGFGVRELPLEFSTQEDHGDLRRRWAEARLAQMLRDGEGRAALVDLGVRNGILTPVTSFYVPTRNEMSPEEQAEFEARRDQLNRKSAPLVSVGTSSKSDLAEQEPSVAALADRKEGGTGTRAKGEEGSLGAAKPTARYAVQGPADNAPARAAAPAAAAAPIELAPEPPPEPAGGNAVPAPPAQAQPAPEKVAQAREFGIIGSLDKQAPAAPAPTAAASAARAGAARRDDPAFGGDGLGLRIGAGGGGKALRGRGLDSLRNLAQPMNSGDEPSPGGGHGRLGGSHTAVSFKAGESENETESDTERKQVANTVSAQAAPRLSISIRIGDLPRSRLGCSGAADVPLAERVLLWRERLQGAGGDPWQVAGIYRRALATCEAPTWRERTRLLGLLLDALPSVSSQVGLWRVMFQELGAASAIYRGILGRVHTPAQMRELHDALGLKSVDPILLARAIKNAKSPGERVKTLRAMSLEWPDDFTLALSLLDALEDADDSAGARAEARALRLRPDADAHLRTAVGELYLRLAAAAKSEREKADLSAEARRAFGEIVEFAPEDPVARRRLGELLCAHGFFADARRQFQTLELLVPDDPSVALLLASAAEGEGLLEEALKWTEKGSAVNAPDSSSTIAARALEATYLAWGRQAARSAARASELAALTARATRVLSSVRTPANDTQGVRVTLTWLHPEFHPNLWSNALGAPMPAAEGDALLGVAQVKVPDRPGSFVEVRLEPDEVERMARLGAVAHLTAVFDELGEHERIVDTLVKFERGGPSTQRFSLQNGELRHD
jgi:Ca-activated chloride channel family protein